jgi:hypothetical protein
MHGDMEAVADILAADMAVDSLADTADTLVEAGGTWVVIIILAVLGITVTVRALMVAGAIGRIIMPEGTVSGVMATILIAIGYPVITTRTGILIMDG